MTNNKLTLSIVIPVYNEEHYIKRCLDAIAAQTVKPLEIIVVDNNCTDKTIAIAKTYPLVRVLKEPVQGRTVSRTRGFNAARGDIIGRIDADSIIMPGWVHRILADFADPAVAGVTGLAKTRVVFGPQWYSTFWSRVYYMAIRSYFRLNTTWGANMAIRRSMWLKIKDQVAKDGSVVHEDQDVSIILAANGGRVIQDNQLLIKTIGATYLYWPKFWEYYKKFIGMKKYYKAKGTLQAAGDLRLSYWRTLPAAVVSWLMTALFFAYSFLSWPFLAFIKTYRAKSWQKIR